MSGLIEKRWILTSASDVQLVKLYHGASGKPLCTGERMKLKKANNGLSRIRESFAFGDGVPGQFGRRCCAV